MEGSFSKRLLGCCGWVTGRTKTGAGSRQVPRCKVLWARMGWERPVTGMTLKLELTALGDGDGVNVGVTEREERRLVAVGLALGRRDVGSMSLGLDSLSSSCVSSSRPPRAPGRRSS